ncbi:Y-family DNA polymerase [Sphingobium sp.]|uniref:Y-family DNA polymerase n=1 Tax=Sphingobium sp. TaxID=1912891 RepID=UPI003BB55CDF
MRLTRPHLSAGQADRPRAFIEKIGGALRLVAVDESAAALGLTPGLSMADARARVPDIDLFDHLPHADMDWLERLADGCTRYTPTIMLDSPDGLILDTGGCDHLFGGEAGLAADLEQRLARLGVTMRHAFAGTPDGARALARYVAGAAHDEDGAIRRLPVAALELNEDATLALRRAGLKTIGDIARRPLSGIAARFGADAVTAIRRILGDADSPLTPRVMAVPLHVERRFAEPIARTETALAILAELAGEAGKRLEEMRHGGRRFEAVFFRTDGMVRRLSVETGAPLRDVPALMRLMRERIDSLNDPIDPGFGFDLIRLHVPLTEALGASQLRLEGGATAQAEVTALVERLSTRLGRGRVRRFAPRDTHMPEQAEFLLPALDTPPPDPWTIPQQGEPPLRPIHLFDPPQPIEVLGAEVPDGPPRRFRWRRALHDVSRFEGPERIAGEWWRRRPVPIDRPKPGTPDETELRYLLGDAAAHMRDYYRVEDRRGRRFWIFRLGFYAMEQPAPRWYMHGLFA